MFIANSRMPGFLNHHHSEKPTQNLAMMRKIQPRVIYYSTIYVAAVVLMVSVFLSQSLPIYGFRWLPNFGATFEHHMSKAFMTQAGHALGSQSGYDGQFYAQLAIDPLVQNPETANAFDDFEFRARRPLFAMTAYAAGGGDPGAVLQAYSFQNIVFWLILAGVLLRWLPPISWQNLFRYVAILYSIGLVASIQQALLDGPALTLIAMGVLLAELRRPWLSAMMLGFAGLGKETSILASSLFGFPKLSDPKQLLLLILKLGIVVLPLALWMSYISLIEHSTRSTLLGSRFNFDWPLLGWWAGVQTLINKIQDGQPLVLSVTTTIFLIALPAQVVALLLMRQVSNLWWRVGATFAVFSFFIGYATWEGVVGSAARICMPVTVAFNILAPRTKKWLGVLIVGNMLSVLGLHAVMSFGPPQHLLAAPIPHGLSAALGMEWKTGWYSMESNDQNYWHWSSGVSEIEVWPKRLGVTHAVLRFRTRAVQPMEITVATQNGPLFRFGSGVEHSEEIEVLVPLHAGANTLYFRSNTPAPDVPGDERPLSFMLMNPTLRTK